MPLFDTGTESYKSDVKMGEVYVEPFTGIEGKVVAISFYEHACERVTLRYAHKGQVYDATFDAAELQHKETKVPVTTTRTGGPSRGTDARRAL